MTCTEDREAVMRSPFVLYDPRMATAKAPLGQQAAYSDRRGADSVELLVPYATYLFTSPLHRVAHSFRL